MIDTLVNKLKVLSEAVSAYTKCELHAKRTQTVFSRGNSEAAICIVGMSSG